MNNLKSKLAVLAVALGALAAATPALAAGDVLKSSTVEQISHSYGRAGGLVGADRIAYLAGNQGNPQVSITYDKDVAERTNMPRDQASNGPIAITQDPEVISRTNMGAGVAGKESAQAVARTK